MDQPIHLCDWSSQPDIHLACIERGKAAAWGIPAWKQPTLPEGVYALSDGRLYTFENEPVTCEGCKKFLGDAR